MKLLSRELTKLFAQKRSYVGWAGLLLVPMLMTLALYLNRNDTHRDNGAGGTTVFLSSHLLNEVEQVCNRAAIINRGRVVVEGPVSELRPEHSAVKLLTSDQDKARTVMATLLGAHEVEPDEEYLIVQANDGTVREVVRALVAAEIGVDAVIPAREQGLEDYFLGLTQSSDVDAQKGGAQ